MSQNCNQLKLFLISFLCGIALTAILTTVSVSCEFSDNCDSKIAATALWQVNLLSKTIPPGPVIGNDTNGQPVYEGSPVFIFILLMGVLAGIPIYTFIIYLVLYSYFRFLKIKKSSVL